MNQCQRIADQFERAFDGNAWHGPSVMALLDGVEADAAARRPIAEAHTIWEIVLHLTTWHRTVTRRMHGDDVNPTPDEDFPTPTDTSPEAWQAALADLRESHRVLRDAIYTFSDDRLPNQVTGKDYSFYDMLHGAVQHDVYHAGQLALLRK